MFTCKLKKVQKCQIENSNVLRTWSVLFMVLRLAAMENWSDLISYTLCRVHVDVSYKILHVLYSIKLGCGSFMLFLCFFVLLSCASVY